MAKTLMLTVDDDPEELRAIERNLRYQYNHRHRVLRADFGAAASERLRRLEPRNEAVGLL